MGVDLLAICGTAFIAVFTLLGVLALLMKIILAVFPQKIDQDDPVILSVISSTISTMYPGTKVTKIEEIK